MTEKGEENRIFHSAPRSVTRRNGELVWWKALKLGGVLAAHIALCLLISLLMIFILDGYQALNNDDRSPRQFNGRYLLRVSDVTTLVSVGLTLVKLCVSSWNAIVIWRCLFFLLESDVGLDLAQFGRMASWGLPARLKGSGAWPVAIILLLTFPQQYIAPLVSGAVGWQASGDFGSAIQLSYGGSVPGRWYWYAMQGMTRQLYLQKAAGGASVVWANIEQEMSGLGPYPGNSGCRHLVNDTSMSINSTLFDATIPCITIHNVTWPTTPASDEIRSLTEDSAQLSMTGEALFMYYFPGNAVLFDLDKRENMSQYFFTANGTQQIHQPDPYRFSGEMTIVLLITRQPYNNCSSFTGNLFNDVSQIKNNFSITVTGADENCFTVGTVNFTAGVIENAQSTYVSSRVVQGSKTDDSPIVADKYVEPALWMLPDVMTMVSLMNTTSIPTWNDLDGYVEKLVRYSYLAAWDTLSEAFEPSISTMTARPYEPRLQAVVSTSRVVGWLCVSALMTVAGSMALMLRGERQTVLDYAAAALLTDPTPLLDAKDSTGLTNLSYVTGKDVDSVGSFRLKAEDGSGAGMQPRFVLRTDG